MFPLPVQPGGKHWGLTHAEDHTGCQQGDFVCMTTSLADCMHVLLYPTNCPLPSLHATQKPTPLFLIFWFCLSVLRLMSSHRIKSTCSSPFVSLSVYLIEYHYWVLEERVDVNSMYPGLALARITEKHKLESLYTPLLGESFPMFWKLPNYLSSIAPLSSFSVFWDCLSPKTTIHLHI